MSKKLLVTFEVEPSKLFDMVRKMQFGSPDGNGASAVGQRVVGAMMTGKTGVADDIGLALYGIAFVSAEEKS